MRRFDLFGQHVPAFNIKGKEVVQTNSGAACSMILVAVVVLYALVKFIHLESKHNPNVTTNVEDWQFNVDDPINLNQIGFRMAFAFEGYRKNDLKNDPRFVKWIFRLYGKKDNVEFERILPYHECTEEDYTEFYPVQKDQAQTLQRVKE